MTKRRRVGAGEYDLYSRYWRHLLCYLDRPGVKAKIKRGTHKRERREGRDQANGRSTEF